MFHLRRIAVVSATLLGTQIAAQEIVVPSGIEVVLYDVILEPDTKTARFRFRAPAIGGVDGVTFGDALPDIQFLCDDVAVPALAENGWTEGEVVISLSAQNVDFGVASPGVVQYFQPFSIQAGACIWEDF